MVESFSWSSCALLCDFFLALTICLSALLGMEIAGQIISSLLIDDLVLLGTIEV
jgi:transporter family-2 protein